MQNLGLTTKSVYALSAEEKRERQQLLETQLMRSLAAYVALRSDESISTVLDDLFSLEMKAAKILGEALPELAAVKLNGSLAGVMTVIPIPNKGITPREREVIEHDPFQLPAHSEPEL